MIPRRIFSDEHGAFRDSVRSFIASEITPHYLDWEREEMVPRSVWRAAGEFVLLCPTVPDEDGGPGADFLYSTVVIEEMARAAAMAPTFYLPSDIVAPYILHSGTEEQKRRWLPGMVTGEVLAAVGFSEPSGGSDLQAIRTLAIRDGDDYVVNGQKVFITNGHSADLIILACKTDPTARARGVSLLLFETDRAGFVRGRKLEKIGCKAQDTSELFFSDVRVPVANLLGEEGKGFYILMKELAQERLIQAIRAVASAEAAIEWTVEHAQQREMFGRTLADFQNTHFVIAQLHAEVIAQRSFVDRCIELHLEGRLDSVDAAAAKLVTTQLQGRVADECLQLFGGWGYMTEYPISRAFTDARMARIGGGAIEVMKQIIGKQIFKSATQ